MAPDSPLAPEAQILQGHLLLKLQAATTRPPRRTTASSTPTRRCATRSTRCSPCNKDPVAYFDNLLARNERTLDVTTLLPAGGAEVGHHPGGGRGRGARSSATSRAAAEGRRPRPGHRRPHPQGARRARRWRRFPELQEGYTRADAVDNGAHPRRGQLAASRSEALRSTSMLTPTSGSELGRMRRRARAAGRPRLRRRCPPPAAEVEARRTRMQARVDALDREAFRLGYELQSMRAMLAAIAEVGGRHPRAAARHIPRTRSSSSSGSSTSERSLKALEQELAALRGQLADERGPADTAIGGEDAIRQRVSTQAARSASTRCSRRRAAGRRPRARRPCSRAPTSSATQLDALRSARVAAQAALARAGAADAARQIRDKVLRRAARCSTATTRRWAPSPVTRAAWWAASPSTASSACGSSSTTWCSRRTWAWWTWPSPASRTRPAQIQKLAVAEGRGAARAGRGVQGSPQGRRLMRCAAPAHRSWRVAAARRSSHEGARASPRRRRRRRLRAARPRPSRRPRPPPCHRLGEEGRRARARGRRPRYFEGMGRTPEEEKQLEELQRDARAATRTSRATSAARCSCWWRRSTRRSAATSPTSYEKAIRDLEVMRAQGAARRHRPVRGVPPALPERAPLHAGRDVPPGRALLRALERRSHRRDARLRGAAQAHGPASSTPRRRPSRWWTSRQSIALYRQLLDELPRLPAQRRAYYLLGYCLEKQNEFEERPQAPTSSSSHDYPKSKFATEAWVRIGEYYFDAYNDPDALAQAAEAYEHAIKDTRATRSTTRRSTSSGWTYYRMDRFDDAVQRFLDAGRTSTSRGRRRRATRKSGGDLRDEALQYTAISFADEKWGSLDKAQDDLREARRPPLRGGDLPPHGRRLLRPDQAHRGHRGLPAGAAARTRSPRTRRRSSRRSSRPTSATASSTRPSPSRRSWPTSSAPGTPWYEKHKRDPDVIAAAQELAEKSLYAQRHLPPPAGAGVQAGGQARAGEDDVRGRGDGATSALPRSASRAPRTPTRCSSICAECLYNSFQFAKAAKNYDAVRDSGADDKYRKDAAFARGARLAEADRADVQGRQEARRSPRCSERATARGREAAAHRRSRPSETALVAASDAFVPAARRTTSKRPGIAYKAAELFYAHNDFPEARKPLRDHRQDLPEERGRQVRHQPHRRDASSSTRTGGASRRSPPGWPQNKDVIDPKSDLYKDLVKFKLAGRFKLADELMAKGDYDEAAKKYIAAGGRGAEARVRRQGAQQRRRLPTRTPAASTRALKLYERIFRDYPKSQARRRGAVPRGGERGELVRLRQGGRELPEAGEGLPGLARTARPRSSTPRACSRASSATPRPRRPSCATPTSSPRRRTRRRTSTAPRSSTRSRSD